MTCYSGFGNLVDGKHPILIGDINGNGRADSLFFYHGDKNWWLGSHQGPGGQLAWSLAGNTANFGNAPEGCPVWIGDFNGDDRAEVLFFYPGDKNWWLGSYQGPGGQLAWSLAGNTANFGNAPEGCPVWIGNFSRSDRAEVLFYYPGDGNWWLGTHDGNQLGWNYAGNTLGANPGDNNFGQVWDGRPFWIGDFNGDGRTEVLFFYPGDKNWWLGSYQGPGGQLAWSLAGNTANFGNAPEGCPVWIGNFSRSDRAEVLFYYPGDGNWWLGTHDGNQIGWNYAGNTLGANPGDNNFGQVWDGRPFWIGDFNGDGRTEVLFFYPGDKNWWLASHQGPGSQLAWSFAGNTANFGNAPEGCPVWIGNFSRSDRAEVLFYYPGDGNWWLGTHDGNQIGWNYAGNTGRPCSQFIRVHFKSLLQINQNINDFIDAQFAAMEELFSVAGIAVYFGTIEDLSQNQALQGLVNLNVGNCQRGQPTQDQNNLFQNRNNVGNDDLVVYILQNLIGINSNPLGCATHPNGQPGAAVVVVQDRWLTAHEIGHVLELRHVCEFPSARNPNPAIQCVAGNSGQSDRLMFPNVRWTNVPPDLDQAEIRTMMNSNLTRNC